MRRLLVAVTGFVALAALAQMRGIPPVRQGAAADGGVAWAVGGSVAITSADGGVALVKLDPPVFPNDGGVATGSNVVASTSYPCSASSVTQVYTLDAGAQTIGTLNPRVYVEVCSSLENDYSLIKCRGDGAAPTATRGSIGETLRPGECVSYGNPGTQPVYCIGNKGSFMQSYECAP